MQRSGKLRRRESRFCVQLYQEHGLAFGELLSLHRDKRELFERVFKLAGFEL
jgi:hypothetical protein